MFAKPVVRANDSKRQKPTLGKAGTSPGVVPTVDDMEVDTPETDHQIDHESQFHQPTFVNQLILDEDEKDDPDYEFTDPPQKDLHFQPSTKAIDKELTKLAQENTPLPDEEMIKF